MDMENIDMNQKEEQLHKSLKDAITHYRAFVVKNQPRNDIAMVSDIQFDEKDVTYSNADISSLEKCTGGTFSGNLRLHFHSNIADVLTSMIFDITYGEYIVDKYSGGEFTVSIKSIICE